MALEDKIVQKAAVKILSTIYEQDFLDSSYGFRENRNAHEALKALELIIIKKNDWQAHAKETGDAK